MSTDAPKRLYDLVRDLEYAHVKHWRGQEHPGDELEIALTQHVNKIETTVSRLRGGNVSVTVVVADRVDSKSLVGYFRLQRGLNGTYSVEGSTLSKE